MRYAFDIIGSKEKAVAILDEKAPKKAAKEVMKRYKHVKSVLQKTGPRSGEYRIHKLKLIAGSKNTEVTHREHGFLIKVDPRKVYFSPREDTERQKIAKKVKKGERILVMFSGTGPFAIAIAKKKDVEIVCVESNLNAVRYAQGNVKLNRLKNIKNYCWDAKRMRGLGKFDRILMPLPETAYQFLDVAYEHLKEKGVIHLYGFSDLKGKELVKKVKAFLKDHNIKMKIVKRQKVLPHSPRRWKIRLDLTNPKT